MKYLEENQIKIKIKSFTTNRILLQVLLRLPHAMQLKLTVEMSLSFPCGESFSKPASASSSYPKGYEVRVQRGGTRLSPYHTRLPPIQDLDHASTRGLSDIFLMLLI